MSVLDLPALRAARLQHEPFAHLVVPGFVKPQACPAIHDAFPAVDRPGSFPLSELTVAGAFQKFIDELEGPALRSAFEEKFDIPLTGRPTMITVRGQCQESDGKIHTDATSKIITVLIYLNPQWEEAGGRLRLLRSADNLDDVILEVPPEEGTLLAFRRSDNSWHGHKPFVGPRRVIQLNWVTTGWVVRRELGRHRLSAWLKRLFSAPARRKLAG